MENSGIYLIRNLITQHLYIGSAKNLKKRRREHFNALLRNKHHSQFLQRSYNKHGISNFVFDVLEYCNGEELIKREQHFIDVLNPRYNMCRIAGNTLGTKRSEETKLKLSISHLGKVPWNKGIPATKEQKKKQSNLLKGRPSPMKGKKWSNASRKRASDSHKGKPANNKTPILQFDLNNNFIAEFDSLTEAQLLTNTKGIYQVLSGRCKTANNFIWKRKSQQPLLPTQ